MAKRITRGTPLVIDCLDGKDDGLTAYPLSPDILLLRTSTSGTETHVNLDKKRVRALIAGLNSFLKG